MRLSALLTGVTVLALLGFAGTANDEECRVVLRIVDADGKPLPGLMRIVDADGGVYHPPELLARGEGLAAEKPINQWTLLPEPATVTFPRRAFTIEALSGLETELARTRVDLKGCPQTEVTLAPSRFYDAAAAGYRSANTHLHLMKLSRDEADRYLREVPRCDRLDALFVSYLERAGADREYISNDYTATELAALGRRAGVIIGNGEEHRHNFTGFGEGYGHVMLLNIKKLIQPVSIGPGIMKAGTDGLPLQRGVDTARRDGASVLWCHNGWGREAAPNLLTGRIDAMNIFDGGTHGSFKDSFYRYLNAGLRVPFSTGTDWFMYDFSRVYARVEEFTDPNDWLASLAAGRTYITNGPFLEMTADGQTIGDTLRLPEPGRINVRIGGQGRVDFGRIELIQNGEIVARAASRSAGGHFEARGSFDLDVTEPCWLALRTPPPPVEDDPELQRPVAKNELGNWLFAHTSPIYVEVAGRAHFDAEVARGLLATMKQNRDEIAARAKFADDQERARVLDVHQAGIAALTERIEAVE